MTLDAMLTAPDANAWIAEQGLVIVLPLPPCPYANHRPTDRVSEAGKSICGICHPPTAAVASGSR